LKLDSGTQGTTSSARHGHPQLPEDTHEHAFHGQKFSGSSSAHEAATRPVHAPLGGHPHACGVITHAVGTQQPCPRLPLWGGHGHVLGGKSRCMAEPETRGRIPVPVLSSPLWDSTRARGVITRAVGTQLLCPRPPRRVGEGTRRAGKGRYMAEPALAAPRETRSGTRVGVAGLYKDPSAPPTPFLASFV
jgi:hypothetical protein